MKLKVHRRCALWLAFLILLVSWWPGCASTPDVVVPTTPVPSATPAAKAKTPPVTSTSRPTPTVTQTPTPSPMVLATPSRTSTPQPVPTGSPTPTRPSTQEPAGPSATATASGPIIHYFRAGVEIADPGDTVTLSWDTSGADHVILYKLFYSGQLPALRLGRDRSQHQRGSDRTPALPLRLVLYTRPRGSLPHRAHRQLGSRAVLRARHDDLGRD